MGSRTEIFILTGKGKTIPSGPMASRLAVTGKYGVPRTLAMAGTRKRMGMASSEPTTARGMIGVPVRMAISMNPPRPNRRR